MTLDDKRKVIEVLLCAGQDAEAYTMTTSVAAGACGEPGWDIVVAADRAWRSSSADAVKATGDILVHGALCITAAYRLIESSATLRREWFGAR